MITYANIGVLYAKTDLSIVMYGGGAYNCVKNCL